MAEPRNFSIRRTPFTVPHAQSFHFTWLPAFDWEVGVQLSCQQQFLEFFRFLIHNIESVPEKNQERAPLALSLSLRAGAVTTYVIAAASIVEGVLLEILFRRQVLQPTRDQRAQRINFFSLDSSRAALSASRCRISARASPDATAFATECNADADRTTMAYSIRRTRSPLMAEKPHPAILDRDGTREIVSRHLAPQAELLDDVASYGSNLVIRAIESSRKDIDDVVLCAVLLKQVVAMLDATAVLFREGALHAANLTARSSFEASLYAEFVQQASVRRARLFLVANYREERQWAKSAIPGTEEATRLRGITEQAGLDIHENRPTLASDAEKRLGEVNEVLSKPGLDEIDREFDRYRKKHKRKRDPMWYELEGALSIKQVAEAVGRLPVYEFFYSGASQVAHVGSYKHHFKFKDGALLLVPVRHVAPVGTLVIFTVESAFRTFELVLKRYRPDELPAFHSRYLNEWRDAFINVPSVNEF